MALSIGIIGAGDMGVAIAHLAALNKCTVALYDINDEVIRRAIERIRTDLKKQVTDDGPFTRDDLQLALERIKKRTQLADLDTCDIIIEAAMEDLRVKRDLFKKLDTIAHYTTRLVSTTSSLSITAIASGTKKPERIAGMRFFQPVLSRGLIEIVRGMHTSDETIDAIEQAAGKLGRQTIVSRDTPGFVVSRIQSQYYGEALRLLQDEAASVETIDRLLTIQGGFTSGPFRMIDEAGIDTHFEESYALFERMFTDPRYRPSDIERQMSDGGVKGKKTKKGFYDNYA
ncbi:MAG TPA: 3-hydroxyacyl-CoA dehydrogenase family protein [Bacteroidota bacterium]|nr:3-hydroxyacyl-CoA dehydrogenase family protein [Bacteroidota bacterium]